MAPPLAAHQVPGGLAPQKSVSGAAARSQGAGAPGLGPPMGSFPASAGGASTTTGRVTAGQRRGAGSSMAAPRASSATAATGAAGKPGGSKKGPAAGKAKQNARFQTAVPPGVDIGEHDLRGYVLECAPCRVDSHDTPMHAAGYHCLPEHQPCSGEPPRPWPSDQYPVSTAPLNRGDPRRLAMCKQHCCAT